MTDFANVLFGGACNRRCYYCIGEQLPARARRDNRDEFPPRGLDAFIDHVNARSIREVVFTGTTTDPQLYEHEAPLLRLLRERIVTGARYSVHTNGVRALARMDVLSQYDRVCISLPSFEPATYAKHMGSTRVPDLAEIVRRCPSPVKVSCVLDRWNAPEVPAFLDRVAATGVKRVVFRKPYGTAEDLVDFDALLPRRGTYRGHPVYAHGEVEVTYWDFDVSGSTSINLFPDGTLGTSYLLAETGEWLGSSERGGANATT